MLHYMKRSKSLAQSHHITAFTAIVHWSVIYVSLFYCVCYCRYSDRWTTQDSIRRSPSDLLYHHLSRSTVADCFVNYFRHCMLAYE